MSAPEVLGDGVALLTIDRPPVNAMDMAAYEELIAGLTTLAADDDVRAVVLIGAGERAFCAGTDVAALRDQAAIDGVLAAGLLFFETLAAFGKPLVGALNGPAVGGGAAIASECDVLLATPRGSMSIPEVQLGVVGGGSHATRLAPSLFKAQRMVLLGEALTPDEALAGGVLAAIAPDRDALLEAAVEIAGQIAALRPDAVREARAIVRGTMSETVLAGYRRELVALAALS